jgi:pimeloyl-ACP methyl ester carboxylesterase
MVTILEYSHLSRHVYHVHMNLYGLTNNKLNKHSIRDQLAKFAKKGFTGWAEIIDVGENVIPAQPFFARLYIKFSNGKANDAVVAFRGTDNWDNDKVDFKSWFSDVAGDGKHDKLPAYLPLAWHFVNLSREYLRKYFPHARLNVTGHSLGGALAQLIVAQVREPVRAITFNSPGIADMPHVQKDSAALIHGVNARYGFINKVGKQLGEVIYIDISQEEKNAKEAFALYQQANQEKKTIESGKHPFADDLLTEEMDGELEQAGIDFAASCAAQHSIANMITALQHHQDIANRAF